MTNQTIPNKRLLEAVYSVRLGIRIPKDEVEDTPGVEWVPFHDRMVPVIPAFAEPVKVSFTFKPEQTIEVIESDKTKYAAFREAANKCNAELDVEQRFWNLGVDRVHMGLIDDLGKGRKPRPTVERPLESVPDLPAEDAYVQPDDRGYRPNAGDPLLRGVARLTGAGAKAVRRTRGTTLAEYKRDDERQRRKA